jgi:hypothetical protein
MPQASSTTLRKRRYIIQRTYDPVPLCGKVAGTAWGAARTARISEYPWYRRGIKQSTAVRMLYDDENVYLQFRCRDKHISAQVIELNGEVCEDSCVEFFATIDPPVGPDYFNLEINCCGQKHMGFGRDRFTRKLITPELVARLRIETSVRGPTKEESPSDRSWWVAAAIPFDMLSEFTARPVRPSGGTVWLGNFYRCGGKTDRQFACWNPIVSPKPDFHRPECFGTLIFA